MTRFPWGLTAAAAIAFAFLIGLGVWQLQRLAWKTDLLAKIAQLQHMPPRPLGVALAAMAAGQDVAFVRVTADCAVPTRTRPVVYRYALRDGRVGWRLMDFCQGDSGLWSGVVLDRGLVDRFAGQMAPTAAVFAPPVSVVGVLRTPGASGWLDTAPRKIAGGWALQSIDAAALALIAGPGARPAPYYLAVEHERSAPSGVTPAALPQDIPNNHFVYALTWLGLAGVLAWIWAGYVISRRQAP
jgi:surfeit locus 1 family protein